MTKHDLPSGYRIAECGVPGVPPKYQVLWGHRAGPAAHRHARQPRRGHHSRLRPPHPSSSRAGRRFEEFRQTQQPPPTAALARPSEAEP